jgi:hypothetical protein
MLATRNVARSLADSSTKPVGALMWKMQPIMPNAVANRLTPLVLIRFPTKVV